MNNGRVFSFFGLIAMAVMSVALTQCGGTGAVANTPATPAANAGGQYTIASATDALYGSSTTCSGTCPAQLTQNGTAVAGSVGIVFGGVNVAFGPFTWTLAGGNSQFSGTMPGAVTKGLNTVTCSFNVNGNFNQNASGVASTFSVNYSNATGCNGQSGSFVLTQQCTQTGSSIDRRRPEHVTAPC